MKKTQKLLIMLTVLAFLVINPVKAQEYMRINQSDGTVIEIAIIDIQKLTFDLTTGMEQHPELVKQLLKLKIYPNPAKEYITIDYLLQEQGEVLIEVYNMSGLLLEKINQGLQYPGAYHHQIDTRNFSSGTYICRVQQNKQFISEKVIVKH